MGDLFITLLYIIFVMAAIVLVVVILLQEGKGGGFGQALGTGGQEAFGVGSRGINTFTASTAGVFLASALLIHVLNRMQADTSVVDSGSGSSVLDGMDFGNQGTLPEGIQLPPPSSSPAPSGSPTPPDGNQ